FFFTLHQSNKGGFSGSRRPYQKYKFASDNFGRHTVQCRTRGRVIDLRYIFESDHLFPRPNRRTIHRRSVLSGNQKAPALPRIVSVGSHPWDLWAGAGGVLKFMFYRSSKMASPWPPPPHSAIAALPPPRRPSSFAAVSVNRAPDAPTG